MNGLMVQRIYRDRQSLLRCRDSCSNYSDVTALEQQIAQLQQHIDPKATETLAAVFRTGEGAHTV